MSTTETSTRPNAAPIVTALARMSFRDAKKRPPPTCGRTGRNASARRPVLPDTTPWTPRCRYSERGYTKPRRCPKPRETLHEAARPVASYRTSPRTLTGRIEEAGTLVDVPADVPFAALWVNHPRILRLAAQRICSTLGREGMVNAKQGLRGES